MSTARIRWTFLPALMAPVLASAHVAAGPTVGFMAGLGHPFSGADHLLAMTAVGAWAAMLGGRAAWQLPATFLAVMIAGAIWGTIHPALAGSESLIAISLLALGALVAARAKAPIAAALGLVALFAFAHGHAHGSEMPADAAGLAYGAGFVAAAALLQAAGAATGSWLMTRSVWFARGVGAGTALAGLALTALR